MFPSWWPYENAGQSPKRRSISRATRARVYERDGNRCVECDSPDDLTLDHRVPLSRGGTNREDNLQTMCRPCNHRKGGNLPAEVAVQRRGPHGEALI